MPRGTDERYIRTTSQSTGTYTKLTVAQFLGNTRKHDGGVQPSCEIETAFDVLDAAEGKIITRKLSDGEMLKMMADENSESWGSRATVDQETVRAVLQAHARGQIDLSKDSDARGGHHLDAPSVLGTDQSPKHPYTKRAVAAFLGWTKKDTSKKGNWKPNARFEVTWRSLELLEAARDRKIFAMWLACYTQQEIADEVGIGRKTVDDISETFGDIGNLSKTAKSAAEHATDFKEPIYKVWKQRDRIGE